MAYLSGILCDICHNRRKVEWSGDGVHKKLAGATTDLLSRISPSELFFKKKCSRCRLGPAVATASVAGLFDFHLGQFGKAGLQSLPDPVSEIFARGVL